MLSVGWATSESEVIVEALRFPNSSLTPNVLNAASLSAGAGLKKGPVCVSVSGVAGDRLLKPGGRVYGYRANFCFCKNK